MNEMRRSLLAVRSLRQLMAGMLLLFVQMSSAVADNEDHLGAIGARFKLINADGNIVTEQILQGRYTLLAFGFTHCLHICPMMAANMAMALKNGAANARGIFISVDTERDTPAITQAYASSYSDAMVGLSGSFEQIRQAANNFNISYVVTKSQKAYTVEHSSDIFLIGPDGKVVEVFALNASPRAMAEAMQSSAN
jgi:cytochrome oxidase Cu insertion factor (SCO1/SenC/PrrC family)